MEIMDRKCFTQCLAHSFPPSLNDGGHGWGPTQLEGLRCPLSMCSVEVISSPARGRCPAPSRWPPPSPLSLSPGWPPFHKEGIKAEVVSIFAVGLLLCGIFK